MRKLALVFGVFLLTSGSAAAQSDEIAFEDDIVQRLIGHGNQVSITTEEVRFPDEPELTTLFRITLVNDKGERFVGGGRTFKVAAQNLIIHVFQRLQLIECSHGITQDAPFWDRVFCTPLSGR